MTEKDRAAKILDTLLPLYPDRRPLLDYKDCSQLVVAVILSAQCTDNQVNRVTPLLFEKYPDLPSLARARLPDLEKIVYPTGFFHQKAKNLKGTSAAVHNKFGGMVPESMEELLTLPGIGRKSAHVIRAHCFDKPAIIVDTHLGRIVRRIGFIETKDSDKVERAVAQLLPQSRWTDFSMVLNRHARVVCTARRPKCHECAVFTLCDRAGL